MRMPLGCHCPHLGPLARRTLRMVLRGWYTEFPYKKTSQIAMTNAEQFYLDQPVDYDDFFRTYVSPRRAIAALGWEHPSIGEFMRMDAAVIFQHDLELAYHNQYVVLKAAIPIQNIRLEFGAAVEFSQGTLIAENDVEMSFAGTFGFFWLFPGQFNRMFSFTGKIAGGGIDDSIVTPFIPITTMFHGFIIRQKLSGLSIFTIDYSMRINQNTGASLGMSYFVRNDLAVYSGYPVAPDKEGYFLGPEFYGRVTWNPFSDLQLTAGGGIFMPIFGNAGTDRARWKIEIGLSRVLY